MSDHRHGHGVPTGGGHARRLAMVLSISTFTTCAPPTVASDLAVLSARVVVDNDCFLHGQVPGYSANSNTPPFSSNQAATTIPAATTPDRNPPTFRKPGAALS